LSLFNELKRRNVIRVSMAYLAGAWLILQVADTVIPWLGLDDAIGRIVLTVLVVGFIPAVVASWLFEWTPDGIRFDDEVEVDPAGTVVARRRLDRIIIGILSLAVVYFAADKFLLDVSQPLSVSGSRSIAVLPFEDISPGGDQAYLGNGIADELRLELQRLDGLRVAGRTSSNAYAQEDSTTIGEILNVEAILEGSVRRAGDRIRITVQLTNVSDGFTLWSQSFDRELDKIFEMQEELATAVAGRLGVSLGVGGVNEFHGAGTRNIDAYEAYLKAPMLGRPGRPGGTEEAISLLERAIRLDPDYGAAWSNLALRVLHKTWDAEVREARQFVDQAHELALRGIELDPESAHAQVTLALIQMVQFNWTGAEQRNLRAIELLDDRPIVQGHALMLMRSGRMGEAERKFMAAVDLEPMDGRPHGQIWHVYLAQQRFAEAQEVASWQHEIEVIYNNLDIAFNKEEPDALKAAIRTLPMTDDSFVHLYGPLLSELDSPEGSRSLLREVYADQSARWARKLHDIAMVAAYIGDAQFALQVKSEEIRANTSRIMAIWYPVMSAARKLPAFKDFVEEINLVDYWRTYGWADACRPAGDNDFSCS
jgi:TolB-like protein